MSIYVRLSLAVCAGSMCILFVLAEVTANCHDDGTLCFVPSCKCARRSDTKISCVTVLVFT